MLKSRILKATAAVAIAVGMCWFVGCSDKSENSVKGSIALQLHYFDNASDSAFAFWYAGNYKHYSDSFPGDKMISEGGGWYKIDVEFQKGESLYVAFGDGDNKLTQFYLRNDEGWFITTGTKSDGSVLGTWYDYKPGVNSVSQKLFLGVVAFSDNIRATNLWNNLQTAKTFINSQRNDVDMTALCYGVSQAVELFDNPGLPDFDSKFCITFTDGFDNGSSALYHENDNKTISQSEVYNQANKDLKRFDNMKSYAVGLTDGSVPINESDMNKLVVGGGEYLKINYSYELSSVFNQIGDNLIASSQNIVLKTNSGVFPSESPKYFKISITAYENFDKTGVEYHDKVYGKLIYNPSYPDAVPIFSLWSNNSDRSSGYISFDNPVMCRVNSSKKIEIPLNSLKFVVNSKERRMDDPVVEISNDVGGLGTYRKDTEDSFASSEIAKKIAVVLVIDCSRSLGAAFNDVKQSASDLIDFLNDKAR